LESLVLVAAVIASSEMDFPAKSRFTFISDSRGQAAQEAIKVHVLRQRGWRIQKSKSGSKHRATKRGTLGGELLLWDFNPEPAKDHLPPALSVPPSPLEDSAVNVPDSTQQVASCGHSSTNLSSSDLLSSPLPGETAESTENETQLVQQPSTPEDIVIEYCE